MVEERISNEIVLLARINIGLVFTIHCRRKHLGICLETNVLRVTSLFS